MSTSIYQQFLKFWKANPQVYARLKELALALKQKGHKKYSINGLFEVLRWEHAMRTTGDSFKLNNNYRAWYARALMQNEPELADFFNIREMQ